MMAGADGAAPAVDGRQRRGDERRERILAAAVHRFAHRGYDATRIADIARDAGVTDAGLIHHFPTKLALFLTIVERREQAYGLHEIGDLDTVSDLLHWYIKAVREAAQRPDYVYFRAMLSGSGLLDGHPIAGRLAANLEGALDGLTPIFRRGIDRGEISGDEDAEQLMLELLALNEGIRAQWVALPGRIDYPAVFERAVNAMYRRIAGRALIQ
ncbi:TetR/AcrR family transcriptional regulator [Arthrobacter sp. B2a2-09]|uniref:TetR/AcrR family transcriptional regulator n=1 Tax=Arthrobacter sp. B2a2-09 TaxID=2952822 RepID=UPI0022CD85DD|nr:TetR/AcrR family transcriptional regulator [Arthrobacter sp. B2a2-09]MCZ9881630.1 TetR/AcrR family transcriptional regulator [Arthrobacter sp. B2a2-09]